MSKDKKCNGLFLQLILTFGMFTSTQGQRKLLNVWQSRQSRLEQIHVGHFLWGLSLLLDSPVRLVHPSPTNWIISSWRMPVSSFSRRNTGDSFFCKINTFLQAPVQLMWQDLSCGREIVMSSRISKPSHGSVTTWATKSTPKAYPDCTLREPLCNGLNHFWFFSFFATQRNHSELIQRGHSGTP